ncbi:MAG: class I SAM-dependent methyltransferase [Patescibacteria group bacterium]|jgi:tellurite methyltransferase
MNYNNIYKSSKNTWGLEPNKLLQIIISEIPKNSDVLDLGSAQGKDSLFLATHKHRVTAVEKSRVACRQLSNILKREKDLDIRVICQDIADFKIENKYFLINIQNVLHFIDKKEGLKIIKKCKNVLLDDGFLIISSFTTLDSSFQSNKAKLKTFFNKQELLKIFTGFHIMYYFEGRVLDKGHPGKTKQHYHEVTRIIVKKSI